MSSWQCPHQGSTTGLYSGFRINDCPAGSFLISAPRRRSGSPPTSLTSAASGPAPGVESARAVLPPTPPFHLTSGSGVNPPAAVNTPAEDSPSQVSKQTTVSPSPSTATQRAPATDLAGELSKALVPVMHELNDLNLKMHDLKHLITKRDQEREEQEQLEQSKGGEEKVEEDGWQVVKSQNVETEKEQKEADIAFRYYDRDDKRLTAGDIVLGAAGYYLVYLSVKMAFRIGRGLWNWGSK